MDTDIRKPVSTKKAALIERPTPTASHTPTTASDTEPQGPTYTEPLSEDEDDGGAPDAADDDDSDDHLGQMGDPMRHAADDEMNVAGLPAEALAQARDARAFREKNRENQGLLEPGSGKKNTAQDNAVSSSHGTGTNGTKADLSKLTPKNLKKMLEQKYQQEEQAGSASGGANGSADNVDGAQDSNTLEPNESTISNGPTYVNNLTYGGKRIAVPVRVEPKVSFALERTLLVSDDVPKKKEQSVAPNTLPILILRLGWNLPSLLAQ